MSVCMHVARASGTYQCGQSLPTLDADRPLLGLPLIGRSGQLLVREERKFPTVDLGLSFVLPRLPSFVDGFNVRGVPIADGVTGNGRPAVA